MVGRLVSWWRGRDLPIWKQLAQLTQLELKDGEFVTRGDGKSDADSRTQDRVVLEPSGDC
jgi:hypothetical protein